MYTAAKHLHTSGANTTDGDDGPETIQINLRLGKAFPQDIDATWEEQGFDARSEFLRYAVRVAVKHSEFSREGWKRIVASEHDLRSTDVKSVSREEVVETMSRDEDAGWRRLG